MTLSKTKFKVCNKTKLNLKEKKVKIQKNQTNHHSPW
jgi:hypothetical protein